MTDDRDDASQRTWERGWEGHDRAQRLRLARLPLLAKLEWLEAAHRLVLHLKAERERKGE